MASLDLGTLVAHIKVEGAQAAQSVLRSISSAMGQTSTSATGAQTGVNSFMGAVTGGLSNVSLFGTNLGTLATAFSGSEAASIAMGTALGGVCTAGILGAVEAVKSLASACAEFIADSVNVGIGFQAQMSKVQAISGESASGLQTLTDAARQFGKDTVFSATEVAQAFEYTALAGYSTQESIAAMPGILNLAAASGMDLGRASDIVTDYLTAFGMTVDDSTHLVDIMAYTMSHTNTDTDQLGEAYKACAATCHTFGVSAEEASAWLGTMANAGYKGEQAGTALNAVLARMYGETKTTNEALQMYGLSMYDSTGKAKNFTQVMGEIQQAMKGMSDEQQNVFLKQVAGTNQLSKFATMIDVSADSVRDLTVELENSGGTTEKMVKTMTDNISGLQKSIGSKVESIKLSIFTAIEPIATDVLKIIEAITARISTMAQPIGNVVGAFLDMFSPIFDGFNRIHMAITDIIGEALQPFSDIFVATFNTIGSLVGGVVDIVVGVVTSVLQLIRPILEIIGAIVQAIIQVGNALSGQIGEKLKPLTSEVSAFFDGIKEGLLLIPNIVIDVANKCIDALNAIPGVCIENIDYLTDGYKESMDTLTDSTEGFIDSAESNMEEYGDALQELTDTGYTNFEEMYEAIQTLDDETYGKLKQNADSYKSEYELQMDALEEFEKDKSREMMKAWEKANKDREGSIDYYLDKAKHQATVEEALANKTSKTKEEINKKYTDKLQKEVDAQSKIQASKVNDNSKYYKSDYDAFAKNEEQKTRKFQEESAKRVEKSTTSKASTFGFVQGVISGIKGAFASGTDYVPSTGRYLVGERGPEIVTLPQAAKVTPNHAIGGNTTNQYNISINASSVREFNDIVAICQNARITERG